MTALPNIRPGQARLRLGGGALDQSRDQVIFAVLLRMPEDPEDEVAVGGLDRLDTLVVGGPGAGGEGLRDCVYPLVVMALDGEPVGAGRPRRQGIWPDPYRLLRP